MSRRPTSRSVRLLAAAQLGLALASTGCRDHCTPGHVTAEREASGTTSTLRAAHTVFLGDGSAVVAVGDGGTIVRRDLQGRWDLRESGVTASLHGVAVGSSPIVVGQGGTVLRSSDAGVHWERVDSGVTADLHAVAVDSVAVAVGDGVIIRSAEPGLYWSSAIVDGEVGSLRALAINRHDNRVMVAVGDGGALRVSHDEGEYWTAVDLGISSALTVVTSPYWDDSPEFWLAGEGGVVAWTEDPLALEWSVGEGGDTPEIVSVNYAWTLTSKPSIGGKLLEVPDYPVEIDGDGALLAIAGAPLEAWVVGTGGLIARVEYNVPECDAIYY